MGLYAKIRETVSEAAIFGMAPLMARGLGFFLTIVYANHLSKEDMGRFGLLLAAEAFATQILGCGLTTSYFRSYFDDDKEARRRLITSTTVWFLLAMNLLFVVCAIPFAGDFGRLLFDEPHADLVTIAIVLTGIDTMNNVPFLVLKARKASKVYVTVSWISGFAQFAAIVTLVAGMGLGVRGAMLGILAGSSVQAVIYFSYLRASIGLQFSARELWPLLALGLPTIFNALATKTLLASDRFIVNYYHGEADVGLYEFANRFAAILPIIIANPFSLIWPAMRFQVMKDDDAREYYSRVLTYLTFLSLYFGVGIAALAPDVIRALVHRDYSEAIKFIPLLVVFYILVATNKGINVGLMIEKKAHWNILVVVATAVVNLVFSFMFIPRWGVFGAVWATVLAYVFFNWFRYWLSNRFYPIDYEWGRILKMVLVAGGVYALTQLVVVANPYISFALRFAVAVTYPVVLAAFGFYDERERRRLAEIWDRVRSRLSRGGKRATAEELLNDDPAVEENRIE